MLGSRPAAICRGIGAALVCSGGNLHHIDEVALILRQIADSFPCQRSACARRYVCCLAYDEIGRASWIKYCLGFCEITGEEGKVFKDKCPVPWRCNLKTVIPRGNFGEPKESFRIACRFYGTVIGEISEQDRCTCNRSAGLGRNVTYQRTRACCSISTLYLSPLDTLTIGGESWHRKTTEGNRQDRAAQVPS